MKFRLLISAFVACLLPASLFAQHGDIEFGYDDINAPSSIFIEQFEVTSDGILLFESEFEALDPFDPNDFGSDEPGFATNASENLFVGESDQIFVNALDAANVSAFGVGYVNYFNPNTGALEAFGQIEVNDNTAATQDLLLNGANIQSGVNPQFLGTGDSDGDVHDHIVFDLFDDNSPLGAYGVLLQLQSDFGPTDGVFDLNSAPFWIVFNHGLDEDVFENQALPAFGLSAIPEPGSGAVLVVAASIFALRRRRRQ